ncbi:MAG: hypothetical protein AB7Q42_07850 [Acidimicrobiia bacterium]
MGVTVTPQEFHYVYFDAGQIADVAVGLLERLGMSDRELRIEVDETTPIARVSIVVGDPLVVRAESGAFEDTRHPRHLSEAATATALGRVLLRARDRLDGTFGEAPPDEELTLAHVAAWETYCVGRLERHGLAVHEQRWRYNFRNRHGFTDAADAAFDRLWAAEHLMWHELAAESQGALAARQVA